MTEIIGFKKLDKNLICKLQILGKNNQKRKVINSKYAQYRCSEAKVLEIYDPENLQNVYHLGQSKFDKKFYYKVDEIVKVYDYDEDIEEVITTGIHYFLTEEAAYFRDLDKIYNGKYYDWCENGGLIAERTYVEGLVEGESKLFIKGKICNIVNYKNGLRNGIAIQYRNSKQKEIECYYINDKKHGLYQEWDKNGMLTEEVNYVLDQKEGIEKKYHKGILTRKYFYIKGRLEGLQEGWWSNGNKHFEHNYHDNVKEGICINYDINGNKTFQQNYNKDQQEGTQLEFYKNGKVQTVYLCCKGKKQGKLIHIDVDGDIDVEENYVDDMLEGLCIYHKLFKRKEFNFSAGKKQGIQRVYNDHNIIRREYTCIDDKKYGIETFYDHYGRKEKEINHECKEGIVELDECYELSINKDNEIFGDEYIKIMDDYLEENK